MQILRCQKKGVINLQECYECFQKDKPCSSRVLCKKQNVVEEYNNQE